nr:hypothetical protein KXZ65_24320 [Pectobacterium sp. PL152]
MTSASRDATQDGKDTQSKILEATLEVILDHGVRGQPTAKLRSRLGYLQGR